MEKFGIEALVANDCELAALAESLYGVSMNANPSIYVTVGTGVGCGVIIDGSVYRGRGHGAAEIGHLRPIVSRDRVPKPMEVKCSGPGIAAEVRRVLEGHLANGHNHVPEDDVEELLSRCNGDLDSLSCKLVAASAINGNEIALEAYRNGTDMIGWGIAQVATLFAPEVVAVGGGVSLAGEEVFFKPLSQAIERYLTPTFHGAFDVLPSALGEEIVVHGALALASVQTDQLVA